MTKATSKTKKIAVITSGGDAPGMNAALRAIVLAAEHHGHQVIGYYHGYNGIIAQHSIKLTSQNVKNIIHLGGTIIKSARCKAFFTDDGVKQAANSLIKDDIDALIVIGGDGSFTGLLKLTEHWQGQVIGLPGTIDNDVDGTDQTIGFATAVNTALEAIDKIRDTADAFDRVFVVELMGRHSGHITFNVGIACGAEQVLSFENTNIDHPAQVIDQLAADIQQHNAIHYGSYLIVMAENLWPEGIQQFSQELSTQTGIDCTPCVLGYIQRGGSPVAKDRTLATKMGVAAIERIHQGKSHVMIGEQNNQLVDIDLALAIKHRKTVDATLIAAQQDLMLLPKSITS